METFYHQWLVEEGTLLNDLLSVPQNRPDLHIPLISRALSHFAEYYGRLSQLADQDIFLVFSAHWLTPIERTLWWHGGMKPDILFHFTPPDLNDDQRRKIEELKQQMVQRETELEAIMREVEMTMMALAAMEAAHGNIRNGEMRGDVATNVSEMIRSVFDEANRLRKHVVSRKIGVLNTAQTVRFLALMVNNHLWTRQLGLHHISRV